MALCRPCPRSAQAQFLEAMAAMCTRGRHHTCVVLSLAGPTLMPRCAQYELRATRGMRQRGLSTVGAKARGRKREPDVNPDVPGAQRSRGRRR